MERAEKTVTTAMRCMQLDYTIRVDNDFAIGQLAHHSPTPLWRLFAGCYDALAPQSTVRSGVCIPTPPCPRCPSPSILIPNMEAQI